MVPAWVVAVYAFCASLGIATIRPMPWLIRLAIASPRLAMGVLYLVYTITPVDIAARADYTRLTLVIMLGVEVMTAVAVRWQWSKAHKGLAAAWH